MYVQTVDFKSLHASENFVDSLRSTGFAVVKNHPVSPDLICDTFREWEKFFAGTEKHAYTFDPCVQAGYFPFKSENAKGTIFKARLEIPNILNTIAAQIASKLPM